VTSKNTIYLTLFVILRKKKLNGKGTASNKKDELVHEKEKFKAISDELDQTFAEMSGY